MQLVHMQGLDFVFAQQDGIPLTLPSHAGKPDAGEKKAGYQANEDCHYNT
jgi:hypothetical protein